jgi:ribosome-binding protein aMBF1 (putative translation factor)
MGALKMEEKKRSDAVDWAYNKYIKGDPEREASFQEELVKAEIARQIYDLREQAGMTQEQLAVLVGTEASVIDDIEEADYEGDFFSVALRIASALHKKVEVRFVPEGTSEHRGCGIP